MDYRFKSRAGDIVWRHMLTGISEFMAQVPWKDTVMDHAMTQWKCLNPVYQTEVREAIDWVGAMGLFQAAWFGTRVP